MKREVSRKKKLRGLKERAWLCRFLVFPSPSLSLLFFSPLTLSRGETEYQGLWGEGEGRHPDPEIRGSGLRHCYRNACKRLWLVKTMKQIYMLIDYNPGVNREKKLWRHVTMVAKCLDLNSRELKHPWRRRQRLTIEKPGNELVRN